MKFDISKCQKNEQGHYLCQTRDGRKARIICTDARGFISPVIALVDSNTGHGHEVLWEFLTNGHACLHGESCNDLINIPAEFEFERWVNIYEGGGLGFYNSKGEADRCSLPDRIACVRVAIKGKEGDGL